MSPLMYTQASCLIKNMLCHFTCSPDAHSHMLRWPYMYASSIVSSAATEGPVRCVVPLALQLYICVSAVVCAFKFLHNECISSYCAVCMTICFLNNVILYFMKQIKVNPSLREAKLHMQTVVTLFSISVRPERANKIFFRTFKCLFHKIQNVH